MVAGLVTTRSATKRRAGIDVISSNDPQRARMSIILICGQLGGPCRHEWAMCVSVFKNIRKL